jgi:hypothetical protein
LIKIKLFYEYSFLDPSTYSRNIQF